MAYEVPSGYSCILQY